MADTAPTVTGSDGKLAAWDPKAGEVVRLAPDELASSFLKGDTHLISAQSYPMLTQDGEVRSVPSKDVERAMRDFGMRFGTQSDVARAEAGSDAAKYRAFGEGILNRAAFGFGDALQVAAGVDPEGIKARAEAHPIARGAGEIAGAIGGGMALGALAPGALLAETAPTATAATAAPSVATTALGTAVEGAVHGAGDAVSEAALGRSDVTAESLIAHAGLGFALGGVLGGAMSIPQARAIRAADRAALMEGAGAEPESLAQAWSRAVDAYRNGPAIRGAEKDLAFQDALLAGSEHLQGVAEGELAAGRAARKQSAINLGRAQRADLRDAEAEARLMDKLRAQGDKGRMREASDLAGDHEAELKAFDRDVARKLREFDADAKAQLRDFDASMRKKGAEMTPGEASRARAALEADLAERRAAIENPLVPDPRATVPGNIANAKTLPPGRGRMISARDALLREQAARSDRLMANQVERQGFSDAAAERANANVADLRQAHAEQSLGQMERHILEETPQISKAREAGMQVEEDRAARDVARGALDAELQRVPGPMLGARGPGMFGRGAAYAAGHLVGGPVGGFIAEELVGGANPVRLAALKRAGNVVREYVGDAMGRVARGAFATSADVSLERSIAPSTLAVLNARDGADRRKALATRMDELINYGDDAAVGQRAAAGTAHFADIAPDAAGLVSMKAVQAANYLRSVAPKPLVLRNPLAPKPSYDLVSDRDAARFAAVDAAVQDPLRVVDELRAGRVPDPEVMRAVQTLYPNVYGSIVGGFQEALANHPEEVSWDTTIRVGLAFGVVTSPALDPSNLSLQQRVASSPPSQPSNGGGAPRQRPQAPRSAAYAAPSTASTQDAR